MTVPTCYPAYNHANRRLRERYGLDLSAYQYADLCHQISRTYLYPDHPAVIVGFFKKRVTLAWKVFGTPTKLVWDYESQLVVTFLPIARSFYSVEIAVKDGPFMRQQMRRRRAYKRKSKYRGVN
jgi:hypothetical protein